MRTVTVEVRDLRVTRGGAEVLHGLTFEVPAGKVTGLLGPSGCGKTTLMRALVGVQLGVSGTVRVLGRPAGDPALRSQVGYVTQSPAVYADLTVGANLAYWGRVLGAPTTQPILESVGLADRTKQVVATLSGGERARVSLAIALLGDPRLLVMDEPTVGLDPVLRRDLWGLFHELAGSGRTLLVSSHVMDEAERCDRLLLLRDGDLLADDEPAALLARTGAADIEGAFLALVSA